MLMAEKSLWEDKLSKLNSLSQLHQTAHSDFPSAFHPLPQQNRYSFRNALRSHSEAIQDAKVAGNAVCRGCCFEEAAAHGVCLLLWAT
jgi:hypothetical protein